MKIMKLRLSQNQKKTDGKEKNPGSKGLQDFGRYSGMAFQMIVIILVMTWGGTRLDKLFNLETPVFTIILSLLGVFGGIYTSIKDFIK